MVDAIRTGCVVPYMSLVTLAELDKVLDLFGTRYRLRAPTKQAFRSMLIERAVLGDVVARSADVSDATDNAFVDVLEQTDAEWLCSDDGAIHATGRDDVLGVGELVRLIEEVCSNA